MTPEMIQALATATKQWHEATRHHEMVGRAYMDAETQRRLAETDLHELARAIEVATGVPVAAQAGELVTSAATPIGAVTMPVVAAGQFGNVPAPSADGIDAAQIVLEEMQRMRMGL